MIEITGLSKRFGAKQALNDVSFTAEDGVVTGFLGPNGAGKSTTMRAALGLITPDSGKALIDGRPFAKSPAPLREVGAVLDAKSAHRSRSAYDHLRALAATNGIPKRRVDEVIDMTGITAVKKRKAGQFSLGMSQRLSIAAALLGDPKNLVLDEPINGLDPEGVKWVRDLCRYYAAEGRAVLLSSHLMSEVALTADNLVIIGQGRILETTTVARFVAEHSRRAIRVCTPDPARLHAIFAQAPEVRLMPVARVSADPEDGEVFRIVGADLKAAARTFAQAQLVTYELVEERASLEDAYMALTHRHAEYLAADVPGFAGGPVGAVSAAGPQDGPQGVSQAVSRGVSQDVSRTVPQESTQGPDPATPITATDSEAAR
ncbi:ATP-binding cassette domain-containing protein [Bifidobacterium eulemuris]|uniref:ATP-binding cassette domain-containing protein n=1 Tax=Bifidobacterium eulemuris TaxID=1765219 RepID=A0A261GDQ2_9BIFI|nr:ATP-binding cassette domain-containing protein [Bifidobacterium eulemuris]OZG69544.1 multidrug ABC transporter ATP-binding protein [Bifidobacterium eulemuris]QOL32090.1 ATP-binding cassette domain-containing protein [Bifidobacterium eulemuris]